MLCKKNFQSRQHFLVYWNANIVAETAKQRWGKRKWKNRVGFGIGAVAFKPLISYCVATPTHTDHLNDLVNSQNDIRVPLNKHIFLSTWHNSITNTQQNHVHPTRRQRLTYSIIQDKVTRRGRHLAPPKCWYSPTRLHGVINHKISFYIFTAEINLKRLISPTLGQERDHSQIHEIPSWYNLMMVAPGFSKRW